MVIIQAAAAQKGLEIAGQINKKFGGYDFVMKAYKEAIKMNYRFFSYGDAMLII